MIYKYTKCESVIAKIMADANMSEKNLRVTDIREWIFEAVEKIGAPLQYIQKELEHPIGRLLDYLIPIPEDLESLIAVAYSDNPHGPWVQVRKNEQLFHSKPMPPYSVHETHVGPIHEPNNFIIEDIPNYTNIVEYGPVDRYTHIPEQRMRYKQPTTTSLLYTEFNHTTDKRIPVLEDLTYFIKPGWIVFNRREGFVKISYKAIAKDERGYPLIPDLASYQEAIYWYVMMKINFPKFLNGTLGGRSKYNFNTYAYIQQQWNFYRNLAYAEAMMPNDGEMLSIKNEWNKLIPDINQDVYTFRNGGREQSYYNDKPYGY